MINFGGFKNKQMEPIYWITIIQFLQTLECRRNVIKLFYVSYITHEEIVTNFKSQIHINS